MAAVAMVVPDAPRRLSSEESHDQSSSQSSDDSGNESADEIVEEYIDSDNDARDGQPADIQQPSAESHFRGHLATLISLVNSITRDLDNLHTVSMLCRHATGRGYSASLMHASGGIKKQISRSVSQMSAGVSAIEAASRRL